MTNQPTYSNDESPTIRIVEAVANVLDVEPTNLDPPLGFVLDPDALDTLCGMDGHISVSVQFQYADCHVTIDDDDIIVENCSGNGQ
jgi:hypothetical protein